MAKNSVSQWSTTAGDNSDVGGINIAENCPAANMNNAMREKMAQIATLYADLVLESAGGTFPDTVELKFGTGEDSSLVFDGTDLDVLVPSGGAVRFNGATDSDELVRIFDNGGVLLNYRDTTRVQTTNTGVTITGNLSVSGTITGDVAFAVCNGTSTPTLATGARNLSVSYSSTGIFVFTFDSAEADANFGVQVTCEDAGGGNVRLGTYDTRTTGGFRVLIRNDSGTLVNAPFTVKVIR